MRVASQLTATDRRGHDLAARRSRRARGSDDHGRTRTGGRDIDRGGDERVGDGEVAARGLEIDLGAGQIHGARDVHAGSRLRSR